MIYRADTGIIVKSDVIKGILLDEKGNLVEKISVQTLRDDPSSDYFEFPRALFHYSLDEQSYRETDSNELNLRTDRIRRAYVASRRNLLYHQGILKKSLDRLLEFWTDQSERQSELLNGFQFDLELIDFLKSFSLEENIWSFQIPDDMPEPYQLEISRDQCKHIIRLVNEQVEGTKSEVLKLDREIQSEIPLDLKVIESEGFPHLKDIQNSQRKYMVKLIQFQTSIASLSRKIRATKNFLKNPNTDDTEADFNWLKSLGYLLKLRRLPVVWASAILEKTRRKIWNEHVIHDFNELLSRVAELYNQERIRRNRFDDMIGMQSPNSRFVRSLRNQKLPFFKCSYEPHAPKTFTLDYCQKFLEDLKLFFDETANISASRLIEFFDSQLSSVFSNDVQKDSLLFPMGNDVTQSLQNQGNDKTASETDKQTNNDPEDCLKTEATDVTAGESLREVKNEVNVLKDKLKEAYTELEELRELKTRLLEKETSGKVILSDKSCQTDLVYSNDFLSQLQTKKSSPTIELSKLQSQSQIPVQESSLLVSELGDKVADDDSIMENPPFDRRQRSDTQNSAVEELKKMLGRKDDSRSRSNSQRSFESK